MSGDQIGRQEIGVFREGSLDVSKLPTIWICSRETGPHAAGLVNDSDRLRLYRYTGLLRYIMHKTHNYFGLVWVPLRILFLSPEALASSYFPLRNPSI